MLHWIGVDNFRSCSDVRLDLDRPVVALVGKNGVGKTNLLHAIHLASRLCVGAAEWSELQPVDPKRPARLELEFSVGGQRYRYAASRQDASDESREIQEDLARVGKDGERSMLRRRGERVERAEQQAPVAIGKATSAAAAMLQLLPEDDPLSGVLQPMFAFLHGVRYYRLTDRILDHQPANPFISESEFKAWAALGPIARGATDSIAMRLIDMHENRRDDFAELATLLGERGLGLVSRIEVSRGHSNGAAESPVAYLVGFFPGSELAGAGRFFPYADLSVGTRRVIQLLTHMVYDQSAVMLLEQPEDSIHGGLVQKLVDVLGAYADSVQVVMSTHSARIVNLLEPDSIRLVTAAEGRTSVESFDEAEVQRIAGYLNDEGTLSEYLETL